METEAISLAGQMGRRKAERTSHWELKTVKALMLEEGCEKKSDEKKKKGRATDAATSTENSVTRIAKSDLSRRVMYASGVVFWPIIARKSDMIDGEDWREPEYAESDNVFQPAILIRRRQRHAQGGVGGASRTSQVAGTTTVDMMPKRRILFTSACLSEGVQCTRTDVRVSEKIGDKSCPTPPPMGFAVANV
jgi:hypothetical protein